MNINSVISLPASASDLLPHRRVKMTATGVAYSGATDHDIGVLLPGDLNRDQAAVMLIGGGMPFVTLGADGAVAQGDELEQAADGKVIKLADGAAWGVAAEAASEENDVIRAVPYGGRAPAEAAPAP